MKQPGDAPAREACEALSHAYGHHADAWEAEALANLFTPNGVFDRLGRRIEGRETIRDFIANRPREWWQTHIGSNFTFELAPDGRNAKGTLDLELKRGKVGDDTVLETLRCRYHDDFVLSDEGWRFKLRQVVMLPSP
ncbi:MAG: nuclear transport factor 2 family protein [Panacagrimonas sp.]